MPTIRVKAANMSELLTSEIEAEMRRKGLDPAEYCYAGVESKKVKDGIEAKVRLTKRRNEETALLIFAATMAARGIFRHR